MGTKNQFRYGIHFLLAGIMCLATIGCIAEDPAHTHTLTILLPDGATQEITPPTICLGVTPPESAWLAEPGPLLPPPEPEPLPTDDDNAANNEEQARSDGDDTENPPLEEEEAEEPDPCVETPGICVGALPPHDWQLENFQPFSCGYGATYGLSALQESITFVVLLAAW